MKQVSNNQTQSRNHEYAYAVENAPVSVGATTEVNFVRDQVIVPRSSLYSTIESQYNKSPGANDIYPIQADFC